MQRRKYLATISATVGGLALAGCSSESDDGGSPTEKSDDGGSPTEKSDDGGSPTETEKSCDDANFALIRAVAVDASTVDVVIRNEYDTGAPSRKIGIGWISVTREDGQRFERDRDSEYTSGQYGTDGTDFTVESESDFTVEIRIDAPPDSIEQMEIQYRNHNPDKEWTTESVCIDN